MSIWMNLSNRLLLPLLSNHDKPRLKVVMSKRFIHVVENFYPRPERIRRRALEMSYSEPEGVTGWRTRAYHPHKIKKLVEQKFRIRIAYWERDLEAIEACNGVFFSAFAHGGRAETAAVHSDEPPSWMMLLVYLTPGAPYECGTSLWQHRATGLIAEPTKKDAERLGATVGELKAKLLRDSQIRSRWIEIDRIGNVFNRAVMFPGGLLHSATKHFGSNRYNGRLYQSFHFPLRIGQGNGRKGQKNH